VRTLIINSKRTFGTLSHECGIGYGAISGPSDRSVL
jgi:hypothetical protein